MIHGSWISGQSGTRRLTELSESVRDAYCDLAAAEFGIHGAFDPNMCLLGKPSVSPTSVGSLVALSKANGVLASGDLVSELKQILGNENHPFEKVDSSLIRFRIVDSHLSSKHSDAIQNSIGLLRDSSDSLAKRFDQLVLRVIPIEGRNGEMVRPMGSGMSVHWNLGCLFLCPPIHFADQPLEFAVNLAHELGHQSLMIYQHSDNIIAGDVDRPVFSAIRRTHRPAILSFHAAVALGSMSEFLISYLSGSSSLHRDYAARRLREISSDLSIAITSFKNVALTELGAEIKAELVAIEQIARAV